MWNLHYNIYSGEINSEIYIDKEIYIDLCYMLYIGSAIY